MAPAPNRAIMHAMTLRDSIGPSAAELKVAYTGLLHAVARLGVRVGEHDPDFVQVAKAMDALHDLMQARERAERGE